MNRESTIDYIEIPAKDLTKAKEFFGKVFGWTFVDYGPDYCSFNDGKTDGGFFQSDTTVATTTGSPLLVFYATDLESAQQRVEAAGGSVVRPTFSFPGGRRFHFSDPNGNEYAYWSDKS